MTDNDTQDLRPGDMVAVNFPDNPEANFTGRLVEPRGPNHWQIEDHGVRAVKHMTLVRSPPICTNCFELMPQDDNPRACPGLEDPGGPCQAMDCSCGGRANDATEHEPWCEEGHSHLRHEVERLRKLLEPAETPRCDTCPSAAIHTLLDHVSQERFSYCPDHEPEPSEMEADRDEERRLRLCAENDMHNMSTERDEARAYGVRDGMRDVLRLSKTWGPDVDAIRADIQALLAKTTNPSESQRTSEAENVTRQIDPSKYARWGSVPQDIRTVVLNELDREAESEDVTDAYQTARRLLWSLWDQAQLGEACVHCGHREPPHHQCTECGGIPDDLDMPWAKLDPNPPGERAPQTGLCGCAWPGDGKLLEPCDAEVHPWRLGMRTMRRHLSALPVNLWPASRRDPESADIELGALRHVLRRLHSAVDVSMGDTDPSDPDDPLMAAMAMAAMQFDGDVDYPAPSSDTPPDSSAELRAVMPEPVGKDRSWSWLLARLAAMDEPVTATPTVTGTCGCAWPDDGTELQPCLADTHPWRSGERAMKLHLSGLPVRLWPHDRREGATETQGQCQNMCPAGWTAHWREWHRGHGCNLDPDERTRGTAREKPTQGALDIARATCLQCDHTGHGSKRDGSTGFTCPQCIAIFDALRGTPQLVWEKALALVSTYDDLDWPVDGHYAIEALRAALRGSAAPAKRRPPTHTKALNGVEYVTTKRDQALASLTEVLEFHREKGHPWCILPIEDAEAILEDK